MFHHATRLQRAPQPVARYSRPRTSDASAVYTDPDDNVKKPVQPTLYPTRTAHWRGGCCTKRAGSDARIGGCCATCDACHF
jgi:hypothetical protein